MKAPTIKTEEAEGRYWATHSAAEFLDTLPAVEIEIVAPRRKREQIALPSRDLDAIKKTRQAQRRALSAIGENMVARTFET